MTETSSQQEKRLTPAQLGGYDLVSIGSLTQEDPLGLAGGLNLYGFASGDPVTFSDPFGLCPIPPTDCPFGHFTLYGAVGGFGAGVAVGLAAAAPTAEVASPLTVPPAAVAGAAVGALGGLALDVGYHAEALAGGVMELGRGLKAKIRKTIAGIGVIIGAWTGNAPPPPYDPKRDKPPPPAPTSTKTVVPVDRGKQQTSP